ncbi:MAG: PucC family protein [Alphaproteobacteria bacterium]|nr:PucC family protein [Alphaproteobacteria bacterium]
MSQFKEMALRKLVHISPRYLPFADAASETLPLGRLLRLSLFQVSVGMALVLLVGTLNRVMIVELSVPASLVGIMISLPLLFAPFRALIGFKSDNHRSALGWRRIPYIWKGTLLMFGGFAVMPFALLVLSGYALSADAPKWIGHSSAALAFLMVGAGAHMVQTVGLALATDLAPKEDQPKVVGLMYVMLLLGMMVSALVFGWLLTDYTPGRLIRVIQGAAVVTAALNLIAMWKQESRDRARAKQPPAETDFATAFGSFLKGEHAMRRLFAIGLGTMGFGMADVLLEPYGGQVLNLTVSETTLLTAVFAIGGLIGFAVASKVLMRGIDPLLMAGYGAVLGIPAFAAVILAAPGQSPLLFVLGTALIGFGAGLFGHGTLTATMRLAPDDQAGLALGAWGAVQATAAGLAVALGGVMRDLIMASSVADMFGLATAYIAVYAFEILLLILALGALVPMLARRAGQGASAVRPHPPAA